MNRRIFPIVLLLASAILPLSAHAAATLYFDAPASSTVGSALPVKLLIDSDEPLNAYAFTVNYSPATLQFIDTNDAGSIITVSRGTPTAVGGVITVKGGSFKPFAGAGGTLLEFDFVPSATGTATISVSNAAVYLANGKGTKVIPNVKNLTVNVAPGAATATSTNVVFPWQVAESGPPSVQYLGIISDPFNPHQNLLAFSVTDAGSGVRETDIRYRSTFFWSDWEQVRNPTSLPNGAWEINFRAINNAGIVSDQILYNWPALWILIAKAAGIVIIIVIFILLLIR